MGTPGLTLDPEGNSGPLGSILDTLVVSQKETHILQDSTMHVF